MFKINWKSEYYPSLREALQARKTVDIVRKQTMELFLSRDVSHVLSELERRSQDELRGGITNVLFYMNVFNYGYILGKRAERARRKGGIDLKEISVDNEPRTNRD